VPDAGSVKRRFEKAAFQISGKIKKHAARRAACFSDIKKSRFKNYGFLFAFVMVLAALFMVSAALFIVSAALFMVSLAFVFMLVFELPFEFVTFIGVVVFAGVETFIGVEALFAPRLVLLAAVLFPASPPQAPPKAATARSAERAKVFFIKLYSPVFSKYILRLQLLEAVS
jgi:hypothetical protein